MSTFSERIKELRLENGMTQTEVGDIIGVKRHSVYTYERGLNYPEKPLWEKLGMDMGQVPNLFGNSKYAFWTVTFTWILYSGFNTIIFLAEMGAIDQEIYEAARVDGAKPWQVDRYITLPLMKNIFGTCVTLASVAMVSQFDIIYMTTKGGPGSSTLNLPIYLYKAATLENNYGKANAVGVIQIVIGISLVLLIQRLFMTKAGEEDGR